MVSLKTVHHMYDLLCRWPHCDMLMKVLSCIQSLIEIVIGHLGRFQVNIVSGGRGGDCDAQNDNSWTRYE